MVRGDPLDQERTIARAIAAGVNYFDTAVQYGNGESEKNLGRVLQRLKPANVAVGTKVRLPSRDFGGIADAVAKSLEGSLVRLCLERVDIFHLHNAITETGGGEGLSVRQVLRGRPLPCRPMSAVGPPGRANRRAAILGRGRCLRVEVRARIWASRA
jgi:aryl-alcohol dehydrogenase-like predicted oxidoreductase